MIEGIEIERFRCFRHSKFEGFKQINVIGGQNNSGKTSLLEILIIALTGDLDKADFFGFERVMNRNELVWEVPEEGSFYINTTFSSSGGGFQIDDILFTLKNNQITHPKTGYFKRMPGVISARTRLEAKFLAEKLDKATRSGKEEEWLRGIRCIDKSIELIRTFTIANNHRVYLKKFNENRYHNLSQMGDAVFKSLEILANTTQNENGYLLIDEIENGIHYSHHEDFWQMLFKLAKEFNVQVFATSHSLEMIKAFNKVALEKDFADISQYMEMFRSARSGEIVANTLAHDTLAYSIANHLSFRGEER